MTDECQENPNPYRAPSLPMLDSPGPVLDTPIRLAGEFTLDHMVRAQLLIQRVGRFRWLHLAGTALIIACLLLSMFAHPEQQTPRGWLLLAVFCGIVLILGLGSYWTAPLMTRLQIREQLRRQFKRNTPVAMTLLAGGLQVGSVDGEMEIAWTAFDRVRQSADLVLLFRPDIQQWQVFPREFLESDRDWGRLREFFTATFPEG